MRTTSSSTPQFYVERWGVLNGFRAKLGSWRLPLNLAADLANGEISRESPAILGSPIGTGALAQKLERALPLMFLAPSVEVQWLVADKDGVEVRDVTSARMSPNRAAAEALFTPAPHKQSSSD